jgi:hypothetical protein
MRRLDFSRLGLFTVLSILTLGFAAGCGGGDSSDDDGGGTGGSGATGGTGGASGEAITWTDMGWIDGMANTYGIQGPWYSYNDCDDAMPVGLPCTQPDTGMMGPDGKPGWSATAEKVCTKGVAPLVTEYQGMPAYSLQWGAGIAFDLNSTGGENAVKNDYDAAGEGITGFAFDIISNTTPPTPTQVRVNYKTKMTGDNSHFVPIPLSKANAEVRFADAMQGSWVMGADVVPNVPANALESIQFQIATDDVAAKPFDFCVSNMRVLK